ncbi:hypothetical protein F4805DRAFT_435693 [Annulohypoxylon moriforme]|nr:hypothetical protein F4805DRAFT_435693 [Annulohypoxylon moriforme]
MFLTHRSWIALAIWYLEFRSRGCLGAGCKSSPIATTPPKSVLDHTGNSPLGPAGAHESLTPVGSSWMAHYPSEDHCLNPLNM